MSKKEGIKIVVRFVVDDGGGFRNGPIIEPCVDDSA
jgi:hypothetical protein